MTRQRLLPALLFVLLAACAARGTGTKPEEAALAPERETDADARPESSTRDNPDAPAARPSGGAEAGASGDTAPPLGRAGAEAPRGGLPGGAGAGIVIDWERVRRHAGDADRGVNVHRHDDTGTHAKPPAPVPDGSPAEGAGTPR